MRLVPVTDDALRTRVMLAEASTLGPPGTEVSFQDYFVRLHHDVAVRGVRFEGADSGTAAPGVMEALARRRAHRRRALRTPWSPSGRSSPSPACARRWWHDGSTVVAVSPIVAGAALKGPADRLMAELGTEPSVVGVARLYAPWVGTLVVDVADAHHASAVEAEGVRCAWSPTVMHSPERAEELARAVVDAAA